MDKLPENTWESWLPVLKKLVLLFITLASTYAINTHKESVQGDLQATESVAGEATRTEIILDDTYQTLQDYVARAAACDSALETFIRHRDDEADWAQVLKKCHSDGGVE